MRCHPCRAVAAHDDAASNHMQEPQRGRPALFKFQLSGATSNNPQAHCDV